VTVAELMKILEQCPPDMVVVKSIWSETAYVDVKLNIETIKKCRMDYNDTAIYNDCHEDDLDGFHALVIW